MAERDRTVLNMVQGRANKWDLRIEGGIRAKVEESDASDNDARHRMCNNRHVECGMDFSKVLMPGYASISGKGPAQPALPRMACDQTSNSSCDDEGFQHDSAGIISDGLIE